MASRIYWVPPSPVDYFEIRVAPTTTGVFIYATVVNDQRPGPNWDPQSERFFYDDPTGTDSCVYRVQGFLNSGMPYDSGPFQPEVAIAAQIATRQKVDHNYGMVDALRYLAPGGSAIPQALIRVFKKPDFDAGRNDLALFITETDNDGRWVNPFWLEPGMTYTLTFEKAGSFGPDKREIVV